MEDNAEEVTIRVLLKYSLSIYTHDSPVKWCNVIHLHLNIDCVRSGWSEQHHQRGKYILLLLDSTHNNATNMCLMMTIMLLIHRASKAPLVAMPTSRTRSTSGHPTWSSSVSTIWPSSASRSSISVRGRSFLLYY